MLSSIYNNKIFKVYLLFTIIVAGTVHKLFNLNTAKGFDNCYYYMLIVIICVYSIIHNNYKLNRLSLELIIIGFSFNIVSSIIYYSYDNSNKYFSLEMEGYSWMGIYGYLRTSTYLLLAYLIGIILWYIKLRLVKSIKST